VAKTKTVTIYGITNCDTMKKARAWLDKHGIAYAFHDYNADSDEGGQLFRLKAASDSDRLRTPFR